MGVVCYTEDGQRIAVMVDPDPVDGTFLVCNLRDAIKEKRKPLYDAIPADQIPMALRGSTDPLKGDTMLVPKAPYDILRFLAPATAVVALPLAVPVLDRQAAFELGDPYTGMETATQSSCLSAMDVILRGNPHRTKCEILYQLFPRCYFYGHCRVGAHIVPRRAEVCFKSLQAGFLAEWTIEDIFSAKNLIVMSRFLEIVFDQLLWCFVPSGEPTRPWKIRIFCDPSIPIPIVDVERTPTKFLKSCCLRGHEPDLSKRRDETPLTFGDLCSSNLVLPDVVSVSAICVHAYHTFQKHGVFTEFLELVPAYALCNKRRIPPCEWLKSIVPLEQSNAEKQYHACNDCGKKIPSKFRFCQLCNDRRRHQTK